MSLLIKDVNLVLPDRVIEGGWLAVKDGVIADFARGEVPAPACDEVLEGNGAYLMPGFVDTHVHGGGGFSFNDETEAAWLTALRLHLKGGTTTIVPTFTSDTQASFLKNIAIFNDLKEREESFTDIPHLAGLHLEGPYFSPLQCGAQAGDIIRNPNKAEYEEILAACPYIKRWSIACELEGALEMGQRLKELGICASIGHSNATWEEANRAVEEGGYSCVTHLYSSCSTLHRNGPYREGGVVEAAFLRDDLDVEMIADGVHLPPLFMQLIYKIKGEDHIAMVTDCIRPGGTNYTEGEMVYLDREKTQRGFLENRVAVLETRACFAGSIATTSRLIRTAIVDAGFPIPSAVKMLTLTPARMLGLDDRIGSIEKGKQADLVMMDRNFNLELCFLNGRAVC